MDQDVGGTPKALFNYDDRIVAFADILGFKALVTQGKIEGVKVIGEIDKAIQRAVEGLEFEAGSDWYSIRLFSDCFCISCKRLNIRYLLGGLARLQLDLAISGLFVRGGISTGLHFENERIIFSEGLVRAYDLQKENVYPRIIVPDNMAWEVGIDDSFIANEEHNQDWLMLAPDGCHFIDYLECLVRNEAYCRMGDEFLVWHKTSILNQIKAHSDDYHILEKYLWAAAYHNHKFYEWNKRADYDEDYYDELEYKNIISYSEFPKFGKPIW